MLGQVHVIPVMQILDICDLVNSAATIEDVCVIGEQLLVYDPSAMVDFLEMGISKADEKLVYASFGEVVLKSLHCVRPHHGQVHALLVAAVDPQRVDLLPHEVGDLISNFLAKN